MRMIESGSHRAKERDIELADRVTFHLGELADINAQQFRAYEQQDRPALVELEKRRRKVISTSLKTPNFEEIRRRRGEGFTYAQPEAFRGALPPAISGTLYTSKDAPDASKRLHLANAGDPRAIIEVGAIKPDYKAGRRLELLGLDTPDNLALLEERSDEVFDGRRIKADMRRQKLQDVIDKEPSTPQEEYMNTLGVKNKIVDDRSNAEIIRKRKTSYVIYPEHRANAAYSATQWVSEHPEEVTKKVLEDTFWKRGELEKVLSVLPQIKGWPKK